MTEALKQVYDMDDLPTKRRVMQAIQQMKGLYEISFKPRKFTRTLSQNSFYWAAVVSPFCDWLRTEWADNSIELEQAHELLKARILGTRELVNKKTGEVIEITRSSRTLDSTEFGEFIEQAAAWLAEFTGIVVLSPEMFYDKKEERKALKYQPKDELKTQLKGSIEMLQNNSHA
jgi:hypothetical protein